jgi:ferredoxin
MIAPESFKLDDVDGHAHAIAEDVGDQHQDQVREAASSCPEQAISVTIDHIVAARAARPSTGVMR